MNDSDYDSDYDKMTTARLNAIIDGHWKTMDGTIAATSLADILRAMIQHLDERLDKIEARIKEIK